MRNLLTSTVLLGALSLSATANADRVVPGTFRSLIPGYQHCIKFKTYDYGNQPLGFNYSLGTGPAAFNQVQASAVLGASIELGLTGVYEPACPPGVLQVSPIGQ